MLTAPAMFRQQREAPDVQPLPPPPPKMLEETAENDCPRHAAPDQKETAGLFKKLASKLKSPATGQPSATSTTPKTSPTIRAKNAPPLTNDFTSKEHREAALRARGLIAPPKKDLSQLEQDLDRRLAKTTPIPREQTTKDGQPSAAEKIMQEWKAKNQAGRF